MASLLDTFVNNFTFPAASRAVRMSYRSYDLRFGIA